MRRVECPRRVVATRRRAHAPASWVRSARRASSRAWHTSTARSAGRTRAVLIRPAAGPTLRENLPPGTLARRCGALCSVRNPADHRVTRGRASRLLLLESQFVGSNFPANLHVQPGVRVLPLAAPPLPAPPVHGSASARSNPNTGHVCCDSRPVPIQAVLPCVTPWVPAPTSAVPAVSALRSLSLPLRLCSGLPPWPGARLVERESVAASAPAELGIEGVRAVSGSCKGIRPACRERGIRS
jgi:hypothetical protein